MSLMAQWRDGTYVDPVYGGYDKAVEFFKQHHIDAWTSAKEDFEGQYAEVESVIPWDERQETVERCQNSHMDYRPA